MSRVCFQLQVVPELIDEYVERHRAEIEFRLAHRLAVMGALTHEARGVGALEAVDRLLHVTDREAFKPVITGIALIKMMHDLYSDGFKWQMPPYEYVYDRMPFDVIAGTTRLREQIEGGASLEDIAGSWQGGENDFAERRRPYLLY